MIKLKFWEQDVIQFYTVPELYGVIPEPKSANKFLPDWFKRLPPIAHNMDRDHFGEKPPTAKKCMPLLDSMSLGYIIPLAGDTHIKTNEDCSVIEAHNPPGVKTCEFHDVRQVGEQTAPGFPANPLKWINHWIIETAPGWSTLFIPPTNHFNPHFTCLSGLVDTDKYPKEVNFPAIWHTKSFDGSIYAGTPLVQVIPIRRDTLPKKAIARQATQKEIQRIIKMQKIQATRNHYYTNELREKK
jgi:hypothetical protein